MTRRKEVQQEQRWDVAADWESKNPVLGPGEIGIEAETGRYKIGDGVKHWNEDDRYYLPTADIQAMIQDFFDDLPTGEVTQQDLTDHIEDSLPHPVYDDGPSLNLLYQNAKV